jgi:hypothetical protein
MPPLNHQRAAIYARVSTFDQEPENQLQELRCCVEARGWAGTEFVDRGVSGTKDKRPRSMHCWLMRNGAGSISSCAGVWTVSDVTSDTS